MTTRTLLRLALLALIPAAAPAAEKAPSVGQALSLAPIQAGVEYAKPSPADAEKCTIDPERQGKTTSWVVRDPSGQVLRRFADTNADNVVDTWSYYQGGLEVYRDIDGDYDSKADQCRWFHTGGSRWGVDDNEDGKIDRWRQISPHEVAEEAVGAVQTKDAARFARLLVSEAELRELGLGKTLAQQIRESRDAAPSAFQKLAAEQKAIGPSSRFVDFGAARPGVIPAGVDGSTKDAQVYENASALVDNGGQPEQLLLGSLLKVGDAWRLVGAPRTGASGPELANLFSVPSLAGATAGAAPPTDEQQEWLAEIEKLDAQATSAPESQLAGLTDRRVELLEKLAAAATTREERSQWVTQLADLLTAAVQSHGYAKGIAKLAELERSPTIQALGDDLVAHLRYRRIGAEYGLAYRDPKANYAKVQEKWLSELEKFVEAHPTGEDAADALLQLGMAEEFAGEGEKAEAWYGRLAKEFPQTAAGKKGAGAARRLASLGKPIALRGKTLDGGQLDLAAPAYRGKFVVVQYWATWCGPCKEDMKTLAELVKKHRGKVAVVGVNLDTSAADARGFVASARTPWPHLYDEGGLDGQRATEMGVLTLPLMLLVDDKGNVANRNLYGADLEGELERLVR